jgi:hypothetical protein
MSDSSAPSTAIFCELFGHQWVPRLRLGLECTRCEMFASEDGRLWPSRRAFEEEWMRSLPALRAAFVRSRVLNHVYRHEGSFLEQAFREWLFVDGFDIETVHVDGGVRLLTSTRKVDGDKRHCFVCRIVEAEPGRCQIRVQLRTTTVGQVMRFDSVRAVEVELMLAQKLDAEAVLALEKDAESVFQPVAQRA